MTSTLIFVAYTIMKGTMMIKRENWGIIQQKVMATFDELNSTYAFSDQQY